MTKKVLIISGGYKDGLEKMIPENTDDFILIGVDGGAIHLVKLGFTPDIAIGDFDSINSDEFQQLKASVTKLIKLSSEKDITDTEAALDYVKEHLNGVDEIEMFGLFGGRVDHTMSNLWLAYQPGYRDIIDKIIMKSENNTLRFFKPGNYTLKKESDKKYLSFIGMTPLEKVTLQNVKYPVNGSDYQEPIALVSNEFLNEQMNFSFTAGLLAVVQSKD